MIDYCIYGDTDSLYIDINKFILNNVNNPSKWINLPDEEKIEYIKKISKIFEKEINEYSFNHIQKEIYNSIEEDFKITWEQEKIAKTGLFLKKKRYATHTIIEDGHWKDKISITGVEIVRSDTPTLFKKALNEILEMILKNSSDDEIYKIVHSYIKEAKTLKPSELSSNISINNLLKYINDDNSYKKGSPWHVKGVANYRKLLKILKIENKYPPLMEGVKAKVIYIKKNPYNVDSVSYQKWPEEFDQFGIIPDKEIMIEKFFLKKVRYLLSPENKENIINSYKKKIDLFF